MNYKKIKDILAEFRVHHDVWFSEIFFIMKENKSKFLQFEKIERKKDLLMNKMGLYGLNQLNLEMIKTVS